MKTVTFVVIGLATAGLGLLWLRTKKAEEDAANPPDKKSDGELAGDIGCGLLELASLGVIPAGACKAGLGVGDKILDAISGLNDKTAKHAAEVARRDAVNKELNGAVKVPMVAMGTGTVQEFANGCQPFYDAPGWKLCNPGTQDMYPSAVDNAFGYFSEYGTTDASMQSEPAFPTMAAKVALINHDKDTDHGEDWIGNNGKYGMRTVEKKLYGSGSVVVEHADPLTSGPYWPKGPYSAGAYHGFPPDYVANADADEKFWYVKGRKVTCPAGQAPALWTADGQPVRDHRGGPDYIAPCVPGGIVELGGENADVAPELEVAGSGTRTDVTCGPGGTAPAGMTWVRASGGVAGHWERLRAGQSPDAGPCDPKFQSRTGELGSELADVPLTTTRAPAVLVVSNPLPSRMVTKR